MIPCSQLLVRSHQHPESDAGNEMAGIQIQGEVFDAIELQSLLQGIGGRDVERAGQGENQVVSVSLAGDLHAVLMTSFKNSTRRRVAGPVYPFPWGNDYPSPTGRKQSAASK
jgi:hypothetical protein